MRVGKETDSLLNDEIDAWLPEEPADGPATSDLFSYLDSDDAETFDEPSPALVQGIEDTESLREAELGGDTSAEAGEPVRMYLREMGTVSLLTREGEMDLAKRIERGQTIAKKALSRSPQVIQEMLRLGDALEQGRVSVQDVLIMPDSSAVDSSTTEEEEQLLERIAEIAKLYEKAQQLRQRLRGVSHRMQPKRHRKLRYSFARSLVRLSRIYRQIEFTAQFQQKTISLIRQAVQDCEPIERAIAKIERKLESSVLGRSAGLREELLATLRQLKNSGNWKRAGDGAPRNSGALFRSSNGGNRRPKQPRSSSSRQISGW